jgi:hypothetical protein
MGALSFTFAASPGGLLALVAAAVLALAPPLRADTSTQSLPAVLAPLVKIVTNPVDAQRLDIMSMTTALPWGAAGFLDNGCTAALIGPRHILAASHCFTFDYDGTTSTGVPYVQGAWQRGLVFFPNYHPDRANPPRVAVSRVIVGTRVQDGSDAPADWGIGYLAEAVSGFPALAIQPMDRWRYPAIVQYPGYARYADRFTQLQASDPQPAPGGYCANFWNNCWWIPALTNPRCLAIDTVDGFVRVDGFSCPIEGGNSGSPVIWNAGTAAQPAHRLTGVFSGGGGFWDAAQFQHAPRFARDVAVATAETDSARTQVFAVDGDLSRVVSRTRNGAAATDPFAYFRDLGSVQGASRLAAMEQANGRPLLVATGFGSTLWVNAAGADGAWSGWRALAGPSTLVIRDIAAAPLSDHSPALFAVARDGTLH